MNEKAAKKIRQALKRAGKWPKENEYKSKKVTKMIYERNPVTGDLKAHQVTRQIVYNVAKREYKMLKKLYKEGKLKL